MKKKGGGERRGGGDRKRKREEKGQRGRQRARKKKRKRKSFFVLFEREGERGERPERETERGSEWKREREKERIVFFMRERAVQERKNRTLVGHEWVDYVLNPKLCPISNFSSKTHGRRPISHKIRKTEKKSGLEIRRGSGPTPVARGGSGTKAPPLAARPYWQVVNRALLRLLSTYIWVWYSLELNLNIKVTKIWYHRHY